MASSPRGTDTAGSDGTGKFASPTVPLTGILLSPALLVLTLGGSPLFAQEGDTLRAGADTAARADSLRRMADTLEVSEAERPPPSDTLTLQEALRTALNRSPDLRGQRAQTSAARAARWADWGAFLPTASARMNVSRSNVRNVTFISDEGFSERLPEPRQGVNKQVTQSLSFTWTLLEGGRRIADMMSGDAAVNAAELRLSEAERRVTAEVKEAYFEARKQQRLVEIARRQLENRRRELEQTRRRYRIAAVNRADLLGARVQVRDAEVRLLDARDRAETARRELQVKMGRRPSSKGEKARAALGPVPSAPDPERLRTSRLVRQALASHPELRALEAEIDRAASQVWGARSGYLPTIRASFGHTRSEALGPEGELVTFDPRNRTNSFSFTASWNLFDGFSRREQTAQAAAQRQQARADRARRRLEIGRTVRDLVDEVKRRERRLELLRDQLEFAEERLDLLSEQYRLGSARFDELQRAIDEVTRAERSVVQERYDYLGAWARLERWVGDVAPGLPSPALDGRAEADPKAR